MGAWIRARAPYHLELHAKVIRPMQIRCAERHIYWDMDSIYVQGHESILMLRLAVQYLVHANAIFRRVQRRRTGARPNLRPSCANWDGVS